MFYSNRHVALLDNLTKAQSHYPKNSKLWGHSNTIVGSQPYQESNGEHNFPHTQTSFVAQSVSDQMQQVGTVAWLIEVLLGVKKYLDRSLCLAHSSVKIWP